MQLELFSVRRLLEPDESVPTETLCAHELLLPPPKITPLRI
jgi:hypothetical protein